VNESGQKRVSTSTWTRIKLNPFCEVGKGSARSMATWSKGSVAVIGLKWWNPCYDMEKR
jgi:hypothetical protein